MRRFVLKQPNPDGQRNGGGGLVIAEWYDGACEVSSETTYSSTGIACPLDKEV